MKSKPITMFVVSGIIIGGMTFPVIVAGAKSVSTPIVSSKKVKGPRTTQTIQKFFDLFNGNKNRNWGISDEVLKIEYIHTEQTIEEMISSIPESSVTNVKKLDLTIESELTAQDISYLNKLNEVIHQLEECNLTFSAESTSKIGNSFSIPWCKRFSSNAENFGDNSFKDANVLTEVILTETKIIGRSAFSGASSLKKISMPKLEKLGEFSFINMSELEELEIGLAEHEFVNIEIRTRSKLKKLNLTNISNLVNADNNGIRSFTNLEYLKTNSKRIGDSVLWGFGKLEVVDMPNATLFGKNSFKESSALESINLPKATEFDDDAFESATALKEVDLPNVISFGARAFNHASSLEKVTLPKVETFKDFAFYEAYSLKEAYFPNVTDFGNYAFYKSLELEKVVLPKATSFGDNAFGYVTGMEELSLPEVEIFGENAFYETEIGVVNLPSIRTLPATSFTDSKIAFIKLADNLTIDHYAVFSNAGTAIGIVDGGTVQHLVDVGESLTIDYTEKLYNLENRSAESWGLKWTKDGNAVENKGSTLNLEEIEKRNAGEYKATIWSNAVPTVVQTELDKHVVTVRNEEEPDAKEAAERNSNVRAYINLSEVPTPPGPGPTDPIDRPETLPSDNFFGINYVSNLDFGEIFFSEEELIASTKWDADLIGEADEQGESGILSYLSVRDFRSDQEREEWLVTVVRDYANFIKGGELTFYPDYSERGSFGEGSKNDFILPLGVRVNDSPVPIVEAEQAILGHSAFTLGDATLSIPAFTVGGDYYTVLTWNVISGPS